MTTEDYGLHTYILDADHRVVKVPLEAWARWFEDFANRKVATDETKFFEISTVFLGLDHSYGKGPPLLFETMVFERQREVKEIFGRLMSIKPSTGEQWRYASWDDALAGHNATVRKIRRHEAAGAKLKAR